MRILILLAMLSSGCTEVLEAARLYETEVEIVTAGELDLTISVSPPSMAPTVSGPFIVESIREWAKGDATRLESLRGWNVRIVRTPMWCGHRHGWCLGLTSYSRRTIQTDVFGFSLEHELNHVRYGPCAGHEDYDPECKVAP
jgi:hypothetical protein